WSDNYNIADAGNFDQATLEGRLSGTQAGRIFMRSSLVQQKIVGQMLQMAAGSRMRFQTGADVWCDWAGNASATDVLAAGGLRVEFDVTPANTTSTGGISFSVGFVRTSTEPNPRLTNSGTDYAFQLRNNGQCFRYKNAVSQGAAIVTTPVTTPRHVILDY